jgi:hypothetical protein
MLFLQHYAWNLTLCWLCSSNSTSSHSFCDEEAAREVDRDDEISRGEELKNTG